MALLHADTSHRVRSRLSGLVHEAKVPGLQYLVLSPSETIFEYAGGWADIAGRRPMTARTTMMAYSMSKTITAAAVLQLVEAQKLGLDDSIDRYLESQPYGSGITIRQLLSHTSGMPNPLPLRWVHPVARQAAFDEHAALTSVLRAHPTPSSKPGATFKYSNIGYWLLGPIVERAAGEAFTSYVASRVMQPLGITPAELAYVIPDDREHARGYLETYSLMNLAKRLLIDRELIGAYEGRWLNIRPHYVNGPAFGGLVGSTTGFGRFLQDQLRPHSKLFGDATRQLLYSPANTGSGTPVTMTLGWHLGGTPRARFFYKEGGGGGFHCMMRVYPSLARASVVMTNATGFNVRRLMDEVDTQVGSVPAVQLA